MNIKRSKFKLVNTIMNSSYINVNIRLFLFPFSLQASLGNNIGSDENENQILDNSSFPNIPNNFDRGIFSPFIGREHATSLDHFREIDIDSISFFPHFNSHEQEQEEGDFYNRFFIEERNSDNNINIVNGAISKINQSENENATISQFIPLIEEISARTNEQTIHLDNRKKVCIIEEIRKILRENKIQIEKIKDDYISKKDRENVYYFEIKVKIPRNKGNNKEHTNKKKILIGRKRKSDNTERKHTKDNPDNIIKKCKGIFFQYIIIYVNLLIKEYKTNKEEKIELLKLNYNKYVNKLKKECELELFEMKLKDLVSFEISDKYKNSKDFNKKKMNKILKEEKDNKILMDLLNMTYGDWIDVFTLKNHPENAPLFNGLQEALEDVAGKSDKEYFSRFVFYLFNYKNYFQNKKGRRPKQNNLNN